MYRFKELSIHKSGEKKSFISFQPGLNLILGPSDTGKTLISYLTEVRISYAEKMLMHTDMTVLNIANSVGYSNQSFFTQTFKKYFQCSPTEYRKRLRVY